MTVDAIDCTDDQYEKFTWEDGSTAINQFTYMIGIDVAQLLHFVIGANTYGSACEPAYHDVHMIFS